MTLINTIIDLLPQIIILSILFDISRYIGKSKEIKFKNEILDLNTNKKYALHDIKNIYSDIYDLHELNEYSINKIQKFINHIKGNLLKSDTKYYYYSILIGTFKRINGEEKKYTNDKDSLLPLLTIVSEELNEEKKFFGLNTREREIFISLVNNSELSESDSKSILELKDIITNRYQELIKKDEKSDRLSKRSIRLGYISLLITAVSVYYSFILDKEIINDSVKETFIKKKT